MISRFEHECGCVFTRNSTTHSFEHTESCNQHGGSLSFGGSRAAPDPYAGLRSHVSMERETQAQRRVGKMPELAAGYTVCNRERAFTFSQAEIDELAFLVNAAQLNSLTERRGHVLVKPRSEIVQAALDRIDARLPILNSIVAKLARRNF